MIIVIATSHFALFIVERAKTLLNMVLISPLHDEF